MSYSASRNELLIQLNRIDPFFCGSDGVYYYKQQEPRLDDYSTMKSEKK